MTTLKVKDYSIYSPVNIDRFYDCYECYDAGKTETLDNDGLPSGRFIPCVDCTL